MGGRRWGRRCHSHLAGTKLFICPCGIKPQRQNRTNHAQERKEQGQKGVKKKCGINWEERSTSWVQRHKRDGPE